MRNDRIRKAWDAVNPTQSQRERMRAALEAQLDVSPSLKRRETESPKILDLNELQLDFTIPEDPYRKGKKTEPEISPKKMKKQPRYYTQRQQKNNRGLLSAVIAAMLMLAVAGGLFLGIVMGDTTYQAAQPTDPTQASGETAYPSTGIESYDEILRKYVDAIDQNWEEQQYRDADISDHIYRDKVQSALGWCLMDVDGNGREELLISDGQYIYDAYTIIDKNGELIHFTTTNDNDQWQLCMDGVFYSFQTVDGKSLWVFYKLEDGFSMQPVKTVVYDHAEDAYFAGRTETAVEPVSKDEAGEMIVSAYPRTVVPVKLFRTGPRGLPMDYEELVDMYITAIKEKWDGGRCAEADISILVRDVPNLQSLGYAFTDLDGDGHEELLITDGNVIYDLYTRFQVTDRMLTHVLTGHERLAYYLSNDGLLISVGSGSAATGEYRFLRIENGAQVVVERLEDVYTLDVNNEPVVTWTHYRPEDLINGVTVTDEKANEIIASYPVHDIAFIPFAQTEADPDPAAVDDALLSLYAKAIPEAMKNYMKSDEKTYCFYDFDGDGNTELILGAGDAVYRVLKEDNGGISIIVPAVDQSYVYLCEGNIIECETYAQGSWWHEYSRIELPDFILTERIQHDEEQDIWYRLPKDAMTPGEAINYASVPVTKAEADAVRAQYSRVQLEWKPLSQFPAPENGAGIEGTVRADQTVGNQQDDTLLAHYAKAVPEALKSYNKPNQKTFCFYDIDNDGRDELLLGAGTILYRILQPRTGDEEMIDIFAPVGEDGWAYVCKDNVIYCQTIEQGNSHHTFIKRGDGLQETETVDDIFYSNENQRWYLGGQGINTPISEDDATAIIDAHPAMVLDWKPLSQFPVSLGGIGLDGTPLFEQVFMPFATGAVSNRLDDVTELLEGVGLTWSEFEGAVECADHNNPANATLTGSLTNVNGYWEIFDLTYLSKNGENEEDWRKATVSRLTGEDSACYIGANTAFYAGAKVEDPNELRQFIFGNDDSLMLKVLATQFVVALSGDDESYMREHVTSDFGALDLYKDFYVYYQDIGEIKGLPPKGTWNENTVTVSVECIVQPDTDSYSYLTLEFVKENGLWKISFYGLEK